MQSKLPHTCGHFFLEIVVRKLISLYTGVGGLDFGFEANGFQTVAAVELDHTACHTLRTNRSWPVLEGDIHSISSKDILAAGNLRPGEADVLVGGPPCQPFSKAGYWSNGDASRLDDPRAGTLSAYLRVLRDTRPKAFLMENVPGLAFRGKDEGLVHVLEGVREVDRQANTKYRVHWQVLNSSHFGVPQLRERVFLVASCDGADFKFPDATHGPVGADLHNLPHLQPCHTAWDAIGDLEENPDAETLDVRGKWSDLLLSIPEGENYLWHTPRGGGEPLFGWRTRYWSFLLKLSKRLPSWTIQAQPGPAIGPFHWRNRRLSTRELSIADIPQQSPIRLQQGQRSEAIGQCGPVASDRNPGEGDSTAAVWRAGPTYSTPIDSNSKEKLPSARIRPASSGLISASCW